MLKDTEPRKTTFEKLNPKTPKEEISQAIESIPFTGQQYPPEEVVDVQNPADRSAAAVAAAFRTGKGVFVDANGKVRVFDLDNNR